MVLTHLVGLHMLRLHSYVESRVFAPPSPRYDYPADVRRWYTKTCTQLYAETGVPCIADEHLTSPKYVVIFTHGNAEKLGTVGDFLHTLAERLKGTQSLAWCRRQEAPSRLHMAQILVPSRLYWEAPFLPK